VKSALITGDNHSAITKIESLKSRENDTRNAANTQYVISRTSEALRDSFENGLSEIKKSTGQLNVGIDNLTNITSEYFQDVIFELRDIQICLREIKNLIKVSDTQKERVEYLQEGIKFLQIAAKGKKDDSHYVDALEEFQSALDIKKRDFLALYFMGYIHLYSTVELDVIAAEEEFLLSAKYFLAEASVNGSHVSNQLLSKDLNFTLKAAEALLYAADACSIQGKIQNSIDLAKKAWDTYPDFSKAGFMLARYLVMGSKTEQALIELRQAISQNRYHFSDTLSDEILGSDRKIALLLEDIENEKITEVTIKVDDCLGEAAKNSIAEKYLFSIKKMLEARKYLVAKEAEDILYKEGSWLLKCTAVIDASGNATGALADQTFKGNVIDFIKFENYRLRRLPQTKIRMKIDEKEREKIPYSKRLSEQAEVLNKKADLMRGKLIASGIGIIAGIIVVSMSVPDDTNQLFKMFFGLIQKATIIIYLFAIYNTVVGLTQYFYQKMKFDEIQNRIKVIDDEIIALKNEINRISRLN